MKKNLIPIILVSASCLLFVVAIVVVMNGSYFELSNQSSKDKTNQSLTQEEQDSTNVEESVVDKNETVEENVSDSNSNTSNGSSSNNNSSSGNVTYTQQDVVSYFQNTDDMISRSSNQEDGSLRQTVKNGFVNVVDFIFYDKEIRGYTFHELTNTAKLQVIKIALSIDSKIDDYFPNYKDTIKEGYTSIKGKLALKYLEFTQSLCESVGEDTCNQAKEDFNTMKNSFGFTWQLIKELASSGSSKVKEFYESWRDQ